MTKIGVMIDDQERTSGATDALALAFTSALTALGSIEFLPVDDLSQRLSASRPDIVYNAARAPRLQGDRHHLAALLELEAIPFTGSGSATLALSASRPRVKDALGRQQVPTAAFTMLSDVADLEPLTRRSFPMALFPPHGVYSARDGVVVENATELEREVLSLLSSSQGPVLVERYLSGAVFCCVMLGNDDRRVVLPPVSLTSVTSPTAGDLPSVDRVPHGLLEVIEGVVQATGTALATLDCVRVDVALSQTGVPHVVAVDPLPELRRDERSNPVLMAADAAGIDQGELIQRCLLLGAARTRVSVPLAPRLEEVRRRTPPRGLRLRAREA
ncbi:MAG: hypothetical protein ACT4P7_00140 [Gemmatimonadaceae bacterium]